MSVRCLISEQKLDYIREIVNQRDPKEDYKLIRSIGVGTYGEVYKALRLNTKNYAAVKIIKVDAKDDIKAVLQEIQTLRDCRHSNIVEFYDSYFRHNKLWICMEFCGGYSMQDIYTNTRKPVDEDCIAFISRETLRGIAYMHSQGKIHRDIKGANILLCNDGAVKIADFGVAAQITHTIQRRNSLIGTPYWMAPEVVAVERKGGYDEKCDIWAVGITAIEYAELQPPMFDLNPLKALRILSMKNYKPPTLRNKSKWSNKFHGFLKYALTKNEKKRPTASLLLTHEFVTQPQLSQSLTLRLLQQNRNPEPIDFGQPQAAAAPVAAAAAGGPCIRPQPANQAATPVPHPRALPSACGVAAKRPLPANAPTTNGSSAKGHLPSKAPYVLPEGVDIKPPATRFPFSSAGMEAASKYVATHKEEVGVVTSPKPKTPPTSVPAATNGVPERILPTPAGNIYPRFPVRGKRLEDVRIMDELAAPLPAYAANTPTASPAPKPATPVPSPTASAASFSSASTSPCSTISTTSSSGSRSGSSEGASSSSDEQVDEEEEDGDAEGGSSDGDASEKEGEPSTLGPSEGLIAVPLDDTTPAQPSRSDSTGGGDRISEFGFRMHGNPSEEEEEDEEEPDFDDIDPEAGFISHPDVLKAARGEAAVAESPGADSSGCAKNDVEQLQRRRPRRGKSDPKSQPRRRPPRRQSSELTEPGDSNAGSVASQGPSVGATNAVSKDSSSSNDFFPEKTGAELADMLRQLKFAQKFAWLAGEPSAAPLGLSSFNPGSVPALHHATSSPDATHFFPTGKAGGDGPQAPPASLTPKAPVNTESSAALRPKTSAPEMSLTRLSSSPFNASPPVAYSPFALSSGVQSVISLAETPTNEQRTPLTTASGDSTSTTPTPNVAEPEATHNLPPSTSKDTVISPPHLPEKTNSKEDVSFEKSEPSATPPPPSPPMRDSGKSLLPERTDGSEPSASPEPLSSSTVSLSKPPPQQQQHAFTSPCLPTQSLETPVIAPTSRSLVSQQPQNQPVASTKQEAANLLACAGRTNALHRILEEHQHLEGGIKFPSGAAPLANQEDEEIDEAEVDLQVPLPRPVTHPRRIRSASDLSCGRPLPSFPSRQNPAFFSCPELFNIPRYILTQRRRRPKRTASAPSVTKDNNAKISVTNAPPPEVLKSVPIEPPIKKPSTSSGEQQRILPTAYLSPQPSRLLRRLRQSSVASGRSRPTSASVPSMEQCLQKSPRMGVSVSGCYATPPWPHQTTIGLPPTPQVRMGACFTLVFEGCPLTINSTASWVNPANNGQILLFGSAEGIYFLSLKDLADRSLELLSSRFCHWLAVVQNTMVSMSGNPPHLYTHNLTTLMKMKASGHSMNAKINRISNFFPKRFSPSNKVPKTKGCLRASLVRSPFTGARYLCAAFSHEILVMEWVNTLSTFIETKRVPVSNAPQPLTTFNLLVQQDLRFPLACLGVYRHHSRRGMAGERYRLHLIDLNAPASTGTGPGPSSHHVDPIPPPNCPLSPPPPGVPADHKKSPKSRPQSGFFAHELLPEDATGAANIVRNNNSVFLESDRLPIVSVIQLLKNTVLVCFSDCAKLVSFNGRLRKKLQQPNTISFDGLKIQSVVGLRDSLLVFHRHGFLGKSFTGEADPRN
uniref:non-specific serine/threonine protein kinase n=1 Tax=Mesocestoides corti TaxID=53468 RepID=A0A5K3ERY7_MESCO